MLDINVDKLIQGDVTTPKKRTDKVPDNEELFGIVDDLNELDWAIEDMDNLIRQSERHALALDRHIKLKDLFEEKDCTPAMVDAISPDFAKVGIYIPLIAENGSNQKEVTQFCIDSTENLIKQGYIQVKKIIQAIIDKIMEWIDTYQNSTKKSIKRLTQYLTGPLSNPSEIDTDKFKERLEVYSEQKFSERIIILSNVLDGIIDADIDLEDMKSNIDSIQDKMERDLEKLGYNKEANIDTSQPAEKVPPRALSSLGWDPSSLYNDLSSLKVLLESASDLSKLNAKLKTAKRQLNRQKEEADDDSGKIKNDLNYLLKVITIWMKQSRLLMSQGIRIASKVT